MKLSAAQISDFDAQGYLFLPDVFSGAEVEVLMREVPEIFAQDRPEVVREKDGETVRSAFAAQTYSEPFQRLSRHPRLVEPAMQLLGGPVYIHQFKVNAKAAFDGDVWQWHQDYGTWARDDEMPEPRALNVALFLEDVTEFNGPLLFIPGSHKRGVLEAGHDIETTSYPLWTIDNETIGAFVKERGMVAPKGKAGSMLLFHCNLVHGSAPNTSARRRAGMTYRYMPATSYFDHDWAGEMSRNMGTTDMSDRPLFLMRGRDVDGRNDLTRGHEIYG